MKAVIANHITIEYKEKGDLLDPAIVLIRGLGTQLTDWPEEFIQGLVSKGFRVIYHDNRDVGLSEKFESSGIPDIAGMIAGAAAGEKVINPPYSMDDMAGDVIGLMDSLEIQKAHVVGISMGGMIAQKLAVNHAHRLSSMTSVMSSSGNPSLPAAKPEAAAVLMAVPEDRDDREAIIAMGVKALRVIGSPGYPESEEIRRKIYTARYNRCYYPQGVARQMAAIIADGSRVEQLKTIDVPTLVIHGLDDPLVPVEAGKDTAAHIPGAALELIRGMGHNIPIALCSDLTDSIGNHCRKHVDH